NYDESKVGDYTLPDPLVCADGTKVTDAATWKKKRRPEIFKLFETQMHGRSPARPKDIQFEVTSMDKNALGGKATRKEITVHFGAEKDAAVMHILLYVPNGSKKPVPAFVGVNFEGNHTIVADPGITIHDQWTWNNKEKRDELTRPAETTRGKSIGSWAVETLMARGYAVATIPRADIEPDFATGWRHGVRGYFLEKSGKSEFAPDDWGAIAAWAWGLSRALDYLETDKDIDAKHVAVMGHSRMGKAALWAGASDERFALVISHDSGESGAALSRRNFGETVERINTSFPHWFCANYKQYNTNVTALPFDAHMLVALAAPRPVYVASAEEDRWADPKGEFLSAKNAGPVYELFKKAGLGVAEWPAVNKPVGDAIGYHVRTGKHDVLDYDWEQYLSFADRHFGRKH
ncbi:MAG: acetylxylan esterase, partial [Verrucomicrobia bacterium]|nr:acetylxylan esterase [Verrucomicrobiota bacterium]